MYYKGGSMLHMIRQLVNDDEKWRRILRGIQSTFRHQTVTGAQVESYVSRASGLDLAAVFQQYLTTVDIPILEYRSTANSTAYRWTNAVTGFAMPVKANGAWLHPTQSWKTMARVDTLVADPNFYVQTKKVVP
jgi:aminopeptidase N